MQDIITSYLVQKKECNLPRLGYFRIKTKAAELDIVNKKIFPPTDEILYTEFADKLSGGLITYLSNQENISPSEAEEKINNWCGYAKERLQAGEKIIFNSIGSLQKDGAGNVFFQRKRNINFFDAVSAERVIHKDAQHSVLVGDRETTSGVMNEFYREEEVTEKKSWWRIWAIVLMSVSLLVLAFCYFTHKFSQAGIGNQSSVSSGEPPLLHYSPK